MDCSLETVKSFLNDWRERNTVLVLFMTGHGTKINAMVVVADFSDDGLALESPILVDSVSRQSTIGPFTLSLAFDKNSLFDYADPRETPAEFKEQAEASFVCTLTINTQGFVAALTEPTVQPESGP